MNVGHDLDGCWFVFGENFHAGLPKIGIPNEHLPKNFDPYNFYELWGFDRDWFTDTCHKLTDAGHLFRTMIPVPGAVEAWQAIAAAGHSIHVITARDYGQPGAALAATEACLREHDMPFESLTVSADKTVVPCDMFVEDHLGNYDALDAVGTEVYLIDQPWNQVEGGDTRRRVSTVAEFADMVLAKG